MYCRNCGTRIPDDSKFCNACGTAINGSPSSNISVETPAVGIANESEAELPREKAAMTRATTEPVADDVSPKSRLAATLLAFFLGSLGVHRFYLGKNGSGAGMLVLTILFFVIAGVTGVLFGFGTLALMNWFMLGFASIPLIAVSIWAFVDFIVAVSGYMKDGQGRRVKKWR